MGKTRNLPQILIRFWFWYLDFLSSKDAWLCLIFGCDDYTYNHGHEHWFWEILFLYDEEHRTCKFGITLSKFETINRVKLGWFVWDLVWRLVKMKAPKQSVKASRGSGTISSSLSAGFQVYHSKCWHLYVSSGCISLETGECFNFSHSFQLVDLLSLFIKIC